MPKDPAKTESEVEGCADSSCSAREVASRILDLVSERMDDGDRWGYDTIIKGADEEAAELLEEFLKQNGAR